MVSLKRSYLSKFVWLAALWLWAGGCVFVYAQDNEQTNDTKPELPGLPDVLSEGTLELKARLYLPDDKGEPRFVPNMRIADLLELTRAKEARDDGVDVQDFTFDKFAVEVNVTNEVADVTTTATVTLHENAERTQAIGLRMQTVQLSEPIRFQGAGKSQAYVGRTDPGYNWSLQGEPMTQHTAVLVGQTALAMEGDRQALQLSLPDAPATINVILPMSHQDVRVRGGSELVRESQEGNQRKVSIRCIGGDLNVSWRLGNEGKPRAGASEATSKTRFRIDDPQGTWEADTEIFGVRAYGESTVDSLVIELPAGAEWMPTPISMTEQYSINQEVDSSDTKADANTPATDTGNSGESASKSSSNDTDNAATKDLTQRVRLVIRAKSRTGLASQEAIPIRWRWTPPTPAANDTSASIAVPMIWIRAVDRHEGTTTLVIPALYGLDWKSPQGIELSQQSQVGDSQKQLQYVFSFARQSQNLLVSFRREANLAEVRPVYLAEIDRDKIKLTGWMQCTFHRSQRPELALELGDWSLDSATMISDMMLPYAEGELLSHQLLPDNVVRLSSESEAELPINSRRHRQIWRIVAYRKLDTDSIDRLNLSLPSIVLQSPEGNRVKAENLTGAFILTASDNVLVSWDERGSTGLLADVVSSEWTALLPQQLTERALVYRLQSGSNKEPKWIGRLEILPRRVAVDQHATVKVDTDAIRITQLFNLQIANEALPELFLRALASQELSVLINDVPVGVEDMQSLASLDEPASPSDQSSKAAIDGSAGSPVPAKEPTDEKTSSEKSAQASRVTKRIRWPKLIGKLKVEVRSQLTLPVDAAAAKTEFVTAVPFVTLDLQDARSTDRAQVVFVADRRLSVAMGTPQPSTNVNDNMATQITWANLPSAAIDLPTDHSNLKLRLRPASESDHAVVNILGAWQQTAVSGSTRMDRFCARFRTQQDSITLSLPASDLLGARIALDGEPQVGVTDTTEGRLRFSLPPGVKETEHTLEVWTMSAANLGWLTAIDVVPIHIEGSQNYETFYWQLVTPRSQHLVVFPDELTPEWSWRWNQFWWARHSPQDQGYFEQWLSATDQQPLADSANRYVLSSYGSVTKLRCWVASRLLLWLPVGLLSILIALGVTTWPILRHPITLAAIVCMLGACAVQWPDLAVLIGQTGIVALTVVLLYTLTQAAIESRVRRRSVFTSRPSSTMLEASDAHLAVRPGSHLSSEIVATTRTQSPIVADSGGH